MAERAAVNFLDARLPDRFWSKVQPCPMSGCWLWTAATHKRSQYGLFGVGSRKDGLEYAHRYSYRRLVGEVAAKLDLDHLCRVRCCVNPAHLEPVTRAENMRRSPIASHIRKFFTHCKRGHEFTPENTDTSGGQRHCITCRRIRNRIAARQRRAVARPSAA